MSDNVLNRLTETLGFDPAREHPISSEVLANVLEEVKNERFNKARERAKDIVIRLQDLRISYENARRQFLKAEKNFERETSKLLNNLSRFLDGKNQEEEEEEVEKDLQGS